MILTLNFELLTLSIFLIICLTMDTKILILHKGIIKSYTLGPSFECIGGHLDQFLQYQTDTIISTNVITN